MKHTTEELKVYLAIKSTETRVIPVKFLKLINDTKFHQECVNDIDEILEWRVPKKPKFIQQGSDSFQYKCECGFVSWHKKKAQKLHFVKNVVEQWIGNKRIIL